MTALSLTPEERARRMFEPLVDVELELILAVTGPIDVPGLCSEIPAACIGCDQCQPKPEVMP